MAAVELARASRSWSPGPAGVVGLLGLTQIVGYGTLYYSFAILAEDMAAFLGWSQSAVYGAFSLALLAGGLVSPKVGRMVDRHGAGRMMAAGSVFAALALAATAASAGPVTFVLGLVLVQVAGTFVLYETAFAAIVQAIGPGAGRSITHLTLIAGFASSLFWPLTTWLHQAMDWRDVLLLFAAANLLVCCPAHVLLSRVGRREAAAHPSPPVKGTRAPAAERPLPAALHRRAMILVAIGFSLGGFMLSAILSQMVPVLAALGLGTSAVAVSTLFGPSQVIVRFANMLLGEARHPIVASLLCVALFPVAAAVLTLTAPSLAGAALFAVILGFGSGLKSIVQGTLPLALFGRFAYGERLGRLAAVRLVLSAGAPFAFAWLVGVTGPAWALGLMAAIGLLGFAALAEVARLCRMADETAGP